MALIKLEANIPSGAVSVCEAWLLFKGFCNRFGLFTLWMLRIYIFPNNLLDTFPDLRTSELDLKLPFTTEYHISNIHQKPNSDDAYAVVGPHIPLGSNNVLICGRNELSPALIYSTVEHGEETRGNVRLQERDKGAFVLLSVCHAAPDGSRNGHRRRQAYKIPWLLSLAKPSPSQSGKAEMGKLASGPNNPEEPPWPLTAGVTELEVPL